MPYATGRIFHDADSHIMELGDFLKANAAAAWVDKMPMLGAGLDIGAARDGIDWAARTCPLHLDEAYRAASEQITLRKNHFAVGSFERDHRAQALDQLGFASQLDFNTFSSVPLLKAEQSGDVDLAHATAEAHNRAMTHFCEVDPRLLAVGYVPLVDIDRAPSAARQAIDMGCKALMIASACPATHSPSHIGLDPLWALAQEAQIPIVSHVGGGLTTFRKEYVLNGLPVPPDFHGGAENFRSVDYMAIPYDPMQTMATLILDGVLERFPTLKWGIIEQGASWLPSWMRYIDSSFAAFRKNESRLQALSLKPSEYVQRQVRVTPYPHEDTGWIIKNSGPDICLFSSDYPHVEGGRNPLKRFGESLEGCNEHELENFFTNNMADLMGPHLPRVEPLAA